MVSFHMNTPRLEPHRRRRAGWPHDALAAGVEALRHKLDTLRQRLDRYELSDHTAARYLELRRHLSAADAALAEAAHTIEQLSPD